MGQKLEDVVAKFEIREVLERYLGSLDDKDWDGIASCFTEDCTAFYNHEPEQINGGKGVAQWLHRMLAYQATNHALSNARVALDGDTAVSHSLVIATLLSGEHGSGRVQVRTIDYVDHFVHADGQWRIKKRVHQPTMQYDAPSQPLVLYRGQSKTK